MTWGRARSEEDSSIAREHDWLRAVARSGIIAPARIDDEEGQTVLLEGKVAIVTGSDGGIGRGTAKRFGHEGARVVVCDVNAANGRYAVATIEREGGQAVFVECDVSRPEAVAR